jgi:hypothetical protein
MAIVENRGRVPVALTGGGTLIPGGQANVDPTAANELAWIAAEILIIIDGSVDPVTPAPVAGVVYSPDSGPQELIQTPTDAVTRVLTSVGDGDRPEWAPGGGGTSASTLSVVTTTAPYTLTTADDVVLADTTGSSPPTALAVSPVGSGGTFPAGEWFWVVTHTAAGGLESVASNEDSATLVASGSAGLAWAAASGSGAGSVYKVYRTVLDATQSVVASALVATLGNVTSYTDTGTAVSAGSAPLGGFAITLPTMVGLAKSFTVKAISAKPYPVTVLMMGGQTINGATSVLLGAPNSGARYRSVTVISDGANGRII